MVSKFSFCFFCCKKKKKVTATTLLLPSLLRCIVAQLHKRKRCVAMQRCLICYAMLRRSSTRANTVYLGTASVPFWFQPQLPCSNSSKLQASATPSSCSKLLLQAPNTCSNSLGSSSKLAPARCLWSSGDGVRGRGVGRW